ncbi:GNAT family N-acetyltransferase [Antribacter gilvus]|uniref:GNAT family N-acetyltransferase n=1 Tax=Antribacter gilvus TaxID=2304675 RepID=UPI000F766213|nr:GNAT family N-acetyltransferase [Antribacter gilvus]
MTTQITVDLVPVSDDVLTLLLALAETDAEPGEVMPPVPGDPGWTEERRAAFRAFHRARQLTPDTTTTEVTFGVRADGEVAGSARLAQVDGDPATREVGLWLGRRFRGRGVGAQVLVRAAAASRVMEAKRLLARTTADNVPAMGLVTAAGFTLTPDLDGGVEAVLDLR